MKEISALRLKTCNYLTDDNDENNKAKCTRKCAKKRRTTIPQKQFDIIIIQSINIWGLWIWMTNSSFNLTDHQQDIDKISLYSKNPYQAKYQLFINKGKGVGVKYKAD